MKRVFAIDVLACPRCCGPMRILGTIRRAQDVAAEMLAPAAVAGAHGHASSYSFFQLRVDGHPSPELTRLRHSRAAG
jgi:hypothetical protein